MNVPKTEESDTWFFSILRQAGEREDARHLESEEALQAFLEANPLTPEEERQVEEALARIKDRLRNSDGPPVPAGSEESRASEADYPIALHRNGGELPPEILAKLEAHRQRARREKKKKSGSGDGPGGGSPPNGAPE